MSKWSDDDKLPMRCRHEGKCDELARDARAQFPDPCEWNPGENRPAFMCEVHASADMIVGANGKWRLCHACAAQPVFRRLRNRRPVARARQRL